ncbi:MAG: metal-dependent hydrolase [Acidobacteriota bacterium]|nr:metal-dependent hydrolase [Acidobacteriota bacterium]
MDLQGIKLTWLGHACFRVETPAGKSFLIDPWVKENPATPDEHKDQPAFDSMLLTHGHFDHIGDAVALAKKYQPTVVGVFELCMWMQKKGAKNVAPMNKGGTQMVGDILVTMVHADHSCGIQEEDGSIVYSGEAVGYVIGFENGVKLYHAGDTNVFGDMHIIHDLYHPEIVLLPIGDQFTMAPKEAAYACGLLRPKTVIPMHFGTFPALKGKPADLQKLVEGMGIEVFEMKPGQTV